MALEITLKRVDNTPWGFRLAGGADCDAPLTAIKVSEGSIADIAGLKVGDVLIKINDADITGLAHLKAHDVILAAGQEFTINVVRGPLSEIQSTLIAEEQSIEDRNEKATNYAVVELPKHDLNLTDEEIQSILGLEAVPNNKSVSCNGERQVQSEISKENIKSETAKVIIEQENEAVKTPQSKFSTFLVKPKGPAPKSKKSDQDKIKSTYRVKIRTKKELEAEKEAKKEKILKEKQIMEENIRKQEETEKATKENEEANEEEESSGTPSESSATFTFSDSDNISEDTISISESGTEPTLSFTASLNSLEAKVDTVQETLNNLSILPQNLQLTLNKIASQLRKIIKIVKPPKETKNGDNNNDEEETSVDGISDIGESEAENGSKLSEMSESTPSIEGEEKTISFTDADCDKTDYEVSEMHELIDGQEPEDETLRQQQKTNKKEKDFPLTPMERPIILPGGRKWSIAEDAVRPTRAPKLTDDKIDQTISSYYEVVQGKTVGESNCCLVPSKVISMKKINFLKYQPPPKPMDHLQKSEVYKMIHEMDPPPKGIIARPEMILAEQDYIPHSDES